MLVKLITVLFIVKLGSALIPFNPPDPSNAPLTARYVIHELDWGSIATISTQQDIKGAPFVGLKSMSDGPASNSTGIPYLYLSDMDVSVKDLLADNRCTLLATEAQSDYCKQRDFDPQDPRCAKVILSGRVVKVDKSSPEYSFGEQALFERHPEMTWWPKDHGFYVAKLNITKIEVLDFFGGMKLVNVDDYFKIILPTRNNILFENLQVEVIQVDA